MPMKNPVNSLRGRLDMSVRLRYQIFSRAVSRFTPHRPAKYLIIIISLVRRTPEHLYLNPRALPLLRYISL